MTDRGGPLGFGLLGGRLLDRPRVMGQAPTGGPTLLTNLPPGIQSKIDNATINIGTENADLSDKALLLARVLSPAIDRHEDRIHPGATLEEASLATGLLGGTLRDAERALDAALRSVRSMADALEKIEEALEAARAQGLR